MTFKKIKEHIVKLSNFPFQLLVESLLGTCLSQTLFFVSIPNVMVLLGLLGDVHKDNIYLEFKGV